MAKEAKNVATSPATCSCSSASPAGCRDTGITPKSTAGKGANTFPSVSQWKGQTESDKWLEVAGPSLRVAAETELQKQSTAQEVS